MIAGMFRQMIIDVSVMFAVGSVAVFLLYFSGLVPSSDAGGLVLGVVMGGIILFGVLLLRSGVIGLPWHS